MFRVGGERAITTQDERQYLPQHLALAIQFIEAPLRPSNCFVKPDRIPQALIGGLTRDVS
jgi:hypothetical protein